MKIIKLSKLLAGFIYGAIRFVFRIIILFTILALMFGVGASFYITLIFIVITFLIFVKKALVIPAEECSCRKESKINKPYDPYEYDRWVPGEPAVTPKAYEQGFFPDDKNH